MLEDAPPMPFEMLGTHPEELSGATLEGKCRAPQGDVGRDPQRDAFGVCEKPPENWL